MHPTILGHMPNLQERMVAGGMSFNNALVPISLCCPSRVSIFTGRHARNHDIVKNTSPNGGFAKVIQQNVEETMFAPLLQNAGYHTALMGKYMNGYHQGEHRIAKGKQSPYEESEKVPFIVVGPGVPAGTERIEPISLIDLAPTFLDWAGLTPAAAESMDGRSLRPLLQGSDPMATWRTAVLFEKVGSAQDPVELTGLMFADRVAPDDEDSEVHVNIPLAPGVVQEAKLPRFEGLHTDRYSYIRYGDGAIEFYDLWSDPFQLNNLAESAPAELLALFETQLAAMVACQGATCRTADTFSLPSEPDITATPTATGLPTATRLPTGTSMPTMTATATIVPPTATPEPGTTATATSTVSTPPPSPTPTATSTIEVKSPTPTVSGVGTPEQTPTTVSESPERLYLPLIVRE